ncbi:MULTISPECIES: RNA polymerase sigma factor [unclassified Bacillus (in: firmicutes)]|uniref:RNA polymerase sigma factor n=1 Tax=unclassified Bacillus (in: firmicutes) TaxID=185979 RepID=UPI0008E7BA5B|nr:MULTISPECIES: sigma-70 family RNA polymerase sigma factor [unclassified Bacillus (in: firmicutes)]SFB07013.1 RNA polymerase sigma-70 factor, ECF subfamily [Bacillus sp. UNCCL13]SFQ87495.1 RNA polymerase sigma-70 factor, ECF subfamily [Bacillus sp. cl95]
MGAIDFNQLYSLYSQRLNYIAYSFMKDRFLAEDIVQEAFIKAYKKIDTIEDVNKVGAWLAAITARTAMDFLRSEKRKNWMLADPTIMEQVIGESITAINTEKEVEIRLLKEDLGKQVRNLSKESQVVLILKHQHGLKENEIAHLLHLKSATVKTRLYRARKQLKQAYLERETA